MFDSSPVSEPSPKASNLLKGLILLSVAMWIGSLFLPVWDARDNAGEWISFPGTNAAMIGWLAILGLIPAWYANLILIQLACSTFVRPHPIMRPLGILAVVIATTAYFMTDIYGSTQSWRIEVRMPGCYLWLASFVVAMIGCQLSAPKWPQTLNRICWMGTVLALLLLGYVHATNPDPLPWIQAATREPTAPPTNLAAMRPSANDLNGALSWVIQYDISENHRYPERMAQAEFLIASGADVNAAPWQFGTPALVHAVTGKADLELIRLLIRQHADVNAHYLQKGLLLDYVESGAERCVVLRGNLQKGLLLDYVESPYPGSSPGSPELKKLLIESGAHHASGADPAKDLSSMQLVDAVRAGDLAKVQALLNAGAEIDPANALDRPLLIAAASGRYEIFEMLLDRHAKMEGALSTAARAGDVKMMEIAIARGADVNNAPFQYGRPLQAAIETRKIDAVECLIRHGANVNEQAIPNPLIQAIELKDKAILKILIDHGADVNVRNFQRESALTIAEKSHDAETAKLIERAGGTR